MARQIYTDFAPDQPAHLNGGMVVCDGVVPIANGYAPLPQFSPSANGTLTDPAIGAVAYRVGSDVYVFAATATNIYRYGITGYTTVQSGLVGSQSIGMRFTAYNMLMLATNGADPIKKFDPGSPSSFTNLGGTPPTARFIGVVGGFVVIGYAAGDSLRLAWSDNGIPTTWAPGTGEAGFYQMPTGGDITGVVGGEYGLIFQENRILRMVYTADDTIWQFQEIASDVGCIAPNSIATYGKVTYFLSNKGIMSTDGVSVTAIGAEKVDRTFLALLSRSYIGNMSAVVDPNNSLYIIMQPSASPPTKAFVFNYLLNKWTTASITTQLLFSALSQGVSLEQLDGIYGNLDLIPISLDDPSFRGGYPLLLMFDGNNRLGSLSGPPMKAVITDAETEVAQGSKTRVRSIRLLSDAPVANVTISGSNNLADGAVSTTYTTRQSSGVYKVRENWGYTQVTVEIPVGTAFSYLQGFDLDAIQGGKA